MGPSRCGIILQMILIGEDSTLTVLPSNIDPHEIEKTLNKMFSPEWLRETAARVGYVQRERKIDPATLWRY